MVILTPTLLFMYQLDVKKYIKQLGIQMVVVVIHNGLAQLY